MFSVILQGLQSPFLVLQGYGATTALATQSDAGFQTAVDQHPYGGQSYPFVESTGELSEWITDFSLSYRDDRCRFEPPFRLAWFYNAGGVENSPIGGAPTPVHDFDLLVLDAEDREVFRSTTAAFRAEIWGDAWLSLEWISDTAHCRVLVTSDYTNRNRHWGPENAYLDIRTLTREPPRVRSITVGTRVFDSDELEWRAGYNLEMEAQLAASNPGGRRRQRIVMSAVPGAGIGRFPACDEQDLVIRTINGIPPADDGTFRVELDSCFRWLRPHWITGEDPRTASITSATVQLRNDCLPCCDCEDYIRVYKAITRLWDRVRSAYEAIDNTRENYAEIVQRWLDQKECRESNPLRLTAIPACPCVLNVSAVLCNTTDQCLVDTELRITGQMLAGGEVVPLDQGIMADVVLGSTIRGTRTGQEPYVLGGEWPIYSVYFDAISPGESVWVLFQLTFPNCEASQSVKLTLSLHSDQEFAGSLELPEAVLELWEMRPPTQAAKKATSVTRPLLPGDENGNCYGEDTSETSEEA